MSLIRYTERHQPDPAQAQACLNWVYIAEPETQDLIINAKVLDLLGALKRRTQIRY